MRECRFCKEPHGDFITDGLFDQCRLECLPEVTVNKKRWTLCVNNSAWTPVKFCPMCGRDLRESEVSGNEYDGERRK